MPIILAIWETEIGGSPFEASQGKQFTRLHLPNNQSKMDTSSIVLAL
jgi:hypothetical protein